MAQDHQMKVRVAKIAALTLAVTGAWVGASAAQSAEPAVRTPAFTPYEQPTADYTSATCAASFGTDGGNVGSIGVCGNIVSFNRSRLPKTGQVPTTGWEAWGEPPLVEEEAPAILKENPYTRMRIDVRRPSRVSGFELEPIGDNVATFTVSFFADEGCGDFIGKISRTVSGNGGALLFAAATRPGVGCMSIRSTDEVGFAIAQLRVTPHMR